MMRMTHLMPAALASALLVAPMLAYGQAPSTGGTGSTPGQTVTPGQPAPPTAGMSPGMTPGGAVGQTPNDIRGSSMGQRGTTPGMGTTPGTTAGTGTTAGAGNQAMFPAGSAVMARPRMSEIIGANVYNQENNSIGSVDDVILVPTAGSGQQGPMAIVQVGGFLGLGGRLVSVPLADLQWNAEEERMVLPGATRESLEQRPEFTYDSVRRSR